MSVMFKWLDNSDSYSVCIDDDDFSKLSRAFSNLKKKSGVFIDPYSDTRLSPEHASILLSDIDFDHALLDMLKISIVESKCILVVGD